MGVHLAKDGEVGEAALKAELTRVMLTAESRCAQQVHCSICAAVGQESGVDYLEILRGFSMQVSPVRIGRITSENRVSDEDRRTPACGHSSACTTAHPELLWIPPQNMRRLSHGAWVA